MRLIDADRFLESEIERCGSISFIGLCLVNNENFKTVLDQQPTVDAVKVVRCINCKHRKYDAIYMCYWCGKVGRGLIVRPDHFCSYGEKRGADE